MHSLHHAAYVPVGALMTPLLLVLAGACAGAAQAPVDAAATPATPASAFCAPLPLMPGGDLASWWIDPTGSPATLDRDHQELVIHNRINTCFHAEIGGMSWDDYEVSGEFKLVSDSSPASRAAGSFGWNLQLCPHDTMIFAQLLGGSAIKIAYVDTIGGRPFAEAATGSAPNGAGPGDWHRWSVLASGGVVATRLDGVAILAGVVPIGTMGMFGLLGNFGSDAELHLRHLSIAFLKPTVRQLEEYARPAAANWRDYVQAQHGPEAGALDPALPGHGLDLTATKAPTGGGAKPGF